jgi:hypothetical protein
MRILLFVAIAANAVDLIATAFGIHLFGNREGNPLLAGLAHGRWPMFVAYKGLLIPLLIVSLYHMRRASPGLVNAGLALVAVAFTVAVGQWLGWIAGVVHVAHLRGF